MFEFVLWESSKEARFAKFDAKLEMVERGELADCLPNAAGLAIVSMRLRRYFEDKRAPRLEVQPVILLERGRPIPAEYVRVEPPAIPDLVRVEKKLVLGRVNEAVVIRRSFAEELVEEGFSGVAFREIVREAGR